MGGLTFVKMEGRKGPRTDPEAERNKSVSLCADDVENNLGMRRVKKL